MAQDEEQLEGPITINIGNVCDGALLEMFDLGMAQLMANIYDMNTPATAKRVLTLTIELKPREDRVQIDTECSSGVKLAPMFPKTSRLFVAGDGNGVLYALDRDPRQMNIFTPPKPVEAPKPIEFKASQK